MLKMFFFVAVHLNEEEELHICEIHLPLAVTGYSAFHVIFSTHK